MENTLLKQFLNGLHMDDALEGLFPNEDLSEYLEALFRNDQILLEHGHI